jgi:hypothetical protein
MIVPLDNKKKAHVSSFVLLPFLTFFPCCFLVHIIMNSLMPSFRDWNKCWRVHIEFDDCLLLDVRDTHSCYSNKEEYRRIKKRTLSFPTHLYYPFPSASCDDFDLLLNLYYCSLSLSLSLSYCFLIPFLFVSMTVESPNKRYRLSSHPEGRKNHRDLCR